jgi:hypothetical protein
MGGGGGPLRGISRKFSGHVSDPAAGLPLAVRPRGGSATRISSYPPGQGLLGPRVIECGGVVGSFVYVRGGKFLRCVFCAVPVRLCFFGGRWEGQFGHSGRIYGCARSFLCPRHVIGRKGWPRACILGHTYSSDGSTCFSQHSTGMCCVHLKQKQECAVWNLDENVLRIDSLNSSSSQRKKTRNKRHSN